MTSNEQQILDVSDAWVQAIARNNATEIAPYMTDEWVLVTPEGGPVAREQFLGAIESGALVHDDMTSRSEQVRIYGDGATLISRVQNHGSYLGQPFTYDEWSTDTYVRGEDGRWRCVVTALTPVMAS